MPFSRRAHTFHELAFSCTALGLQREYFVSTVDYPEFNCIRTGRGRPLLLIHGLGGTWRSWKSILPGLAQAREVIAVDLPGHGLTPRLNAVTTIPALADAVTSFVRANDLVGIDAVGSSMGARLVMELARRGGVLGSVVALNPGGFWRGWERLAFFGSLWASIRLVRLLQPVMPAITRSRLGRTALLAQFSARPWRLPPSLVLDEMRSYAASPVFDELLYELAYGDPQEGAPAGGLEQPLAIGWGRHDRVCFPWQASRALTLFPDAQLHWFQRSGHFPAWDEPEPATRLILDVTSGRRHVSAATARARRRGVADLVKRRVVGERLDGAHV